MKVSIVIPVYQVENYVADCIRSVKKQTLRDFEVICIHDGGNDGSWEVVKQEAGEAPEGISFRLYENDQNRGLAATRNRGLDLAEGDYVYFLDSDDMICPDAMEQLWKRAEEEALDVEIFGTSFIYETKELEEKFRTNPSRFKGTYPDVIRGQELYIKWMKIWDWMPSQPRFFYRRSFLKRHGIRYADGMLHEDETFAFDVLMYAERVRVTNDLFFIRRFRAASIMSSTPTIRNIEGCIEILHHVSTFPCESEALNEAIKYYMYKIFRDVTGKYKAMAEDTIPKRSLLSAEVTQNPSKMAIFQLIETFGLWKEV